MFGPSICRPFHINWISCRLTYIIWSAAQSASQGMMTIDTGDRGLEAESTSDIYGGKIDLNHSSQRAAQIRRLTEEFIVACFSLQRQNQFLT